MRVCHDQLEVRTHAKGLYEITDEVLSKVESFYHHDRRLSVLHCPEIFAVAAVAGISDPGYLLRIPHFGLAHPFQLKGKSLTAHLHRLEGHAQEAFTKSFPLGKGASRSLCSEFIDGVAF